MFLKTADANGFQCISGPIAAKHCFLCEPVHEATYFCHCFPQACPGLFTPGPVVHIKAGFSGNTHAYPHNEKQALTASVKSDL